MVMVKLQSCLLAPMAKYNKSNSLSTWQNLSKSFAYLGVRSRRSEQGARLLEPSTCN